MKFLAVGPLEIAARQAGVRAGNWLERVLALLAGSCQGTELREVSRSQPDCRAIRSSLMFVCLLPSSWAERSTMMMCELQTTAVSCCNTWGLQRLCVLPSPGLTILLNAPSHGSSPRAADLDDAVFQPPAYCCITVTGALSA